MIFGKTFDELKQERIQKAERLMLLEEPNPWFAWKPVRLMDGRYAWLKTVTRHACVCRHATDRAELLGWYYEL